MEIGHIEAIFRYPVKSMAGEPLESADLGWHGIEGDRRLALRRLDDHSGFPWLTASKLPDLIRYIPVRPDSAAGNALPTHVRTPGGEELPIYSEELATDVRARYGAAVEMTHLRHGIFDDASISLIASETVRKISRLANQPADFRRFRPNLVVRLTTPSAFQEHTWLDTVLSIGEGENAPAIAVSMHDIRCSVINLDPDTAASTPEVLKAVVRANQNNAGIYGTVIRTGRIAVGTPLFLQKVDPQQQQHAAHL